MTEDPKSTTEEAFLKKAGPKISLISVSTVSIIIAAIAGIATLVYWRAPLDRDFSQGEIFKTTYQFLLLTVIGGLVSLIYTQLTKAMEEIRLSKEKAREQNRLLEEKAQEQRSTKRDLQIGFYTKFIGAYNSAKRARRILRATARESAQGMILVRINPYGKELQTLIDIQLQFETLIDEVEARPDLFFSIGNANNLKSNLSSIEEYLNDIVDEYENLYQIQTGNSSSLPITKLPKLAEFIGKYRNAVDFQNRFKKPAREITGELLKLISDIS